VDFSRHDRESTDYCGTAPGLKTARTQLRYPAGRPRPTVSKLPA
jgi:hypothetical protein